jgi:hypothetical protein
MVRRMLRFAPHAVADGGGGGGGGAAAGGVSSPRAVPSGDGTGPQLAGVWDNKRRVSLDTRGRGGAMQPGGHADGNGNGALIVVFQANAMRHRRHERAPRLRALHFRRARETQFRKLSAAALAAPPLRLHRAAAVEAGEAGGTAPAPRFAVALPREAAGGPLCELILEFDCQNAVDEVRF